MAQMRNYDDYGVRPDQATRDEIARRDGYNPKTGYPAGQGHGRHKNMEHPNPDAVASSETDAPAA
jgi:hypothetical protein